MAASMQGICQVFPRIFLSRRSLHGYYLAQTYAWRVTGNRQKRVEHIKTINFLPRDGILRKTLCTDKIAETQITQRDKKYDKSHDRLIERPTVSGESDITETLHSNEHDERKGDIAARKKEIPDLKGNIEVSHKSLYSLAADLKSTVESQEQQAQSPAFYRRRVESEFGGDGKRQTFKGYQDSKHSDMNNQGPGQFVETPPIVQENRKIINEPAYYYGFAGIVCCCIVFSLAFFRKEQEDTIELLIAKSWVAEKEGNLAEAEALLHKALKMAQDDKNTSAVTYIFDQLANLSMRHGNLTKAENLFKETLKLMISSGTAQDDSAVVEISLKLARMFDRMRRYDDAEQGFKWCISTTEKKLAEANDKETTRNLQSLLGMCLDCYARHLAAHGRLQEAKDTYKRALLICEEKLKVDGVPHPQTVILLNDLGTVNDLGGNYTEAIELIQRAADLAEKRSPRDLPTILCNLASVNMHAEKFEEARSYYKKALSLAEKQGDAAAILEIKNSLAQLDTNIFLKQQKEGRKKQEAKVLN